MPHQPTHLISSVIATATLISSLSLTLISTEVSAEDAQTEVITQEPTQASKKLKTPFHAYATVFGLVAGSMISEPKNKTIELNGATLIAPYPGFGGVGGGGGLSVGLNWEAISLEVGLEWSADEGEGRIDGFTYTLSQTTRHIPLTLRFEVPGLKVRPSLFGGVDWVSPSGAELTQPEGYALVPPITGVASESYTAWRFGLGFDILLNNRMRIPLRITANYTPMERNTIDDLVVKEEGVGGAVVGIRYRSTWHWQPHVSFGFRYDFALF